jgi:uroporphyrinogen decarboxylase
VLAYLAGRRDEVVESMKRDYVDFVRATEMDIVAFPMSIVPGRDAEFFPLEEVGPDRYRDANGNGFVYSSETHELIHCEHGEGPVRLCERNYTPTPGAPYAESELEFARHVLSELGDTRFVVAPAHFAPPRLPIRAADNALVDSVVNVVVEGRVQEYVEQRVGWAANLGRAAAFWKSLGADAVWGGQDVGHNRGTFVSPAMCREMLLPVWRAQVEYVHAAGLPIIWHACGNNRVVWDQFAEAGIDAYQAIQDEEPLADLKREYGHCFTLIGGVSCRTLDSGTPEDVREQTRRAIDTAAPGGGFVLASSHSLHAGVKRANFLAMLDVWRQRRGRGVW